MKSKNKVVVQSLKLTAVESKVAIKRASESVKKLVLWEDYQVIVKKNQRSDK